MITSQATKPTRPHEQAHSQKLFSEQEVSVLKEQTGTSVVWMGSIVFAGFFALGLWSISTGELATDRFNPMMAFWSGLGVFFIAAFLYHASRTHRRIRADLNGGHKVVFEAELEGKREKAYGYSSRYYCTLAGQEFEVSFEQWEPLRVGQLTEIHFAPHSRYVFTITTQSVTTQDDHTD